MEFNFFFFNLNCWFVNLNASFGSSIFVLNLEFKLKKKKQQQKINGHFDIQTISSHQRDFRLGL